MKTILVAGHNGQVAQCLSEISGQRYRFETVGRPEMDITDRESIQKEIRRLKPNAIINAAAYTSVDKAETDAETAYSINRDGAGNLAIESSRCGLPIIQLSTDYVFSGDKDEMYVEEDVVAPLGVYGCSKLAGEVAVQSGNPNHAILRTSWVYSPYGANFLKTMLRLASDRHTVSVVSDQHGTPTYAPDIASGIVSVLDTVFKPKGSSDWRGTFHMVAGGQTDWASFAEEIFTLSAQMGGPHAQVKRITTAEYPTPARRPVNSRLSTLHFEKTFSGALPDWRSGVKRCLERLLREN